MSGIRWQKISEALARLGHEVDIATDEPRWQTTSQPLIMSGRLRRVPLKRLHWRRYDVVKTLFHLGFETLVEYGGGGHPFIVSKLGSVVGPEDRPGIYFYGDARRRLWETQTRIYRISRFVTLLSPAAIALWREVHGSAKSMLLVPGAADGEIPAPGPSPYHIGGNMARGKICLFSGNVYYPDSQPEANRQLVRKLNELGCVLAGSDVQLCFQGVGDTSGLDTRYVRNLGSCSYADSWNYMQHASVGIVVSAGPFMHNNESTKIYHYLRAGLPVVSEEGFPNDHVVRESGLGFVVPGQDMQAMAKRILEACNKEWDRSRAIRYILNHHTWDCRAQTYQTILPQKRRWFTRNVFSRR